MHKIKYNKDTKTAILYSFKKKSQRSREKITRFIHYNREKGEWK